VKQLEKMIQENNSFKPSNEQKIMNQLQTEKEMMNFFWESATPLNNRDLLLVHNPVNEKSLPPHIDSL
jgi:hypothetical protein